MLAVVALALPASAGHQPPVRESYSVTAPVPYPVDGASHCTDGLEGMTKNTRQVKLPSRGVLEIELSGFLGDWVLELFDAKGRLLGQAAELDPTNTAPVRKVTYKKATPGQLVKIAVCNVEGGPTAKVAYTFTHK
ncbi:MAG TPA: hypothetical protein VNB94_00510 [Mycobacteriales bacterium]|nr:hypothetical protein [Mycobacteriales bacterium]